MMQYPRICVLTLVALGCSPAGEEPITSGVYPHTTTGTPEPTLVTSTGNVASSGSTASTTVDDTATETSCPGTTTSVPDFGDSSLGCNGKIDFLFVIDREIGMAEYWPKFQAAFPKFIEDVLATFENFDMHFMVVDGYGPAIADTPSGWGMPGCLDQCLENNGSCMPVGPEDYPCDAYQDGVHTTCGMIGAGVVFPAGFEASNHDCGVVGGRRYVDSTKQPDLENTVKCISKMGYGEAISAPDVAMFWGLAADKKPSECNQGFLREDALLVIIYYTYYNDVDGSSQGPPEQWAETLYGLKGGDEDQVAVIGIIDDHTYEPALAVCPPGTGSYSLPSAGFLHFSIKHKIEGSLCAEDYAPYFGAGLDLLVDLCDAEIPT